MEEGNEEVVIVPPPDIRGKVDKMAEYVAQVGASFESKVFAREKNNPAFQFLSPTSHYHAYYRQQIVLQKKRAEAHAQQQGGGVGEEASEKRERDEETAGEGMDIEKRDHDDDGGERGEEKNEENGEDNEEERAGKIPRLQEPAELRFSNEAPESMAAVSYEVIGLTAEHAAVNGPAFVQALMNRERGNALFGFLQSGHAHHEYFESVVRQYEQVLELQKADAEKRREMLEEDRAAVLQRVLVRVEWERAQREKKMREEAAAKKGAAKLAEDAVALQVDWDDFVVVQTIDLADDPSLLPPPLTVAQLKALASLKEAQTVLPSIALEPAPVAAPVAAPSLPPPPPPPSSSSLPVPEVKVEESHTAAVVHPASTRVVQDYVPGAAAAAPTANGPTQKCPICGLQIPIAQMEQHMKIETMSKKHIEHLKEVAQGKKSAMAPDDEIARNIKDFSLVRTDIYDTGSEAPEAVQKKRKVEAQALAKPVWDGHADSVEAAVSLEAQIRAIHAVKGSDKMQADPAIGPAAPQRQGQTRAPVAPAPKNAAAPVPVAVPVAAPPPSLLHPYNVPPGGMLPPPGSMVASMMGGRGGVVAVGAMAVPEEQWKAMNPSPFMLKVAVAKEEAGEKTKTWKLDGSTQEFEVENTTTVEELKQMIEARVGLPPNLQKLKHAVKGFLKDKETCAYYNLRPVDVLELTRQQRGGKKK